MERPELQSLQGSQSLQRGMQDTCVFTNVVKDGRMRRLVRRWDGDDETPAFEHEFDDTASWESWRSAIDSCQGGIRTA